MVLGMVRGICLCVWAFFSVAVQSVSQFPEVWSWDNSVEVVFFTLSLCLSGLCQSNVALSLWWRNPVLQCIFKTIKTLFEWQKGERLKSTSLLLTSKSPLCEHFDGMGL